MDSLVRSVAELKEMAGYKGNLAKFKSSKELVLCCRKFGVIADIKDPSDICKSSFDDYYTHLCALAKKYLFEHRDLKFWSKFATSHDNRKVHKIFHEFGVARGSGIFSEEPDDKYDPTESNTTKITLEELYDVYQIKYNFDGSFLSFKKQIQKAYGSYAEFCLAKGLDINTTKWESDETAIRVARKLGSVDAVKEKCPSLLKYLEDKKLLREAFQESVA
ncbi:hypothetical protein AZI85_17240 [Bdellovibrio bacteriovorus]|uniref:Uncharacterized protein n=1 Tax=Bdellovibrio bacteriovorus TaxID=959 RepID=A0A150WTK1_BDEBC|nr:hypothetical protein [Bdellovibrio bacteriovorus]KYG67624.1 hypothetical protein AZI85_17240 [Bdellovibrio bacteriovorus]